MKWVLRILGVVFVLALCAGYYGYRKYRQFTAAGNTTAVLIGAPRERVFGALANSDSIAVWMGRNSSITSTRHGALQPGDTLAIQSANDNGNARYRFTWTVREVVPNQLLAMDLRTDTSTKVIATRRDSLVASGDSTIVISTVASPMFDQVRMTERDSNRSAAAGAMLNVGAKLALSAFRFQSETELKRLKAHIEGKQ
jgi:uncharacterized protein YndB with AHSA1/START domain